MSTAIQKVVPETASPALALEGARVASPTTFIEKITPRSKRCNTGGKGKEKVNASMWEDAGMALKRAYNVVTPDDLKELFGSLLTRW